MVLTSSPPITYADLLDYADPANSIPAAVPFTSETGQGVAEFGQRRSPGEYVLSEESLTSVYHDSSIVDRALAGLRQGLINFGMLHTPLPVITQMDLEAQHVFNFAKFGSPETASYALTCIKQSIAKYTIEDLEQDDLQVSWSESSLTTTDLGPDSELQSLQSLSIVRWYEAELQNEIITTNEVLTTVAFHERMAHDLEACYFDSPSSSNGDRTCTGLGSELLDIRLVASTGRLHDLRGGRAIAAKLALHIRLAKRARFGVIFAPPYFVLVESVVIDGQSHLLVGDLHSVVFDPDEPRATVKPFNAIFLALLMNHHVDYRIASPAQHVFDNVVFPIAFDSAPEADNASALDRPPIVSSNSSDDPFRLSPGAGHASLPGDDDSVKKPESKRARSESEGPSKLFTCNGVTATLHLAPGQTIICDAKILPESRMAASPIELQVEYETASSSLSDPLRANKKIRLDVEASRRSNLVSEALPPELQQLFKRASTFVLHKREFKVKFAPPSGSRLDLVRRIGRGASSTVWQAQWVQKGVASGRPHLTRRSCCVGVGQARQYFPAFYGLYQSGTEGHAYVLVMEDAGSTISHEQLQLDSELKAKVDAALKLIADEGLVHGDEGARNVLLRPDGRICLIDWGEALLR